MAKVNYFATDFDTFKQETLALLQQSVSWQDMYEGGAGTTLVELFSYIGASNAYYIMRAAEEAFLATCKLRSSLNRHARSLGYEPHMSTAALGTVKFSLNKIKTRDTIIPLGTQLTTEDGKLYFETTAQAVIPANQTVADNVPVKQKRTFKQVLMGRGTANQTMRLENTPYLDGETSALDNLGYTWTEVDSMFNYGPDDRVYTVDVDGDNRATVRFGDGVNGVPPSTQVTVTYAVGGGYINLATGTITKIVSRVYDTVNNLVDGVSVTNQYAIVGGTDEESFESAKANAIATLKSNSRTIAGEDFVNNAIKAPGVARAMWQTKNENATVPDNAVFVYIVPTVGFGASTEEMTELISECRNMLVNVYPCPPTLRVDVYKAPDQSIDISVQVRRKTSYSVEQVNNNVRTAIASYFDYTARDANGEWILDFGQPVYLSDLYRYVAQAEGVESAIVTAPTGDTTTPANTMPSLGNVDVVVTN